jgi:hypothetical protein
MFDRLCAVKCVIADVKMMKMVETVLLYIVLVDFK